jgi:hypothetical protein
VGLFDWVRGLFGGKKSGGWEQELGLDDPPEPVAAQTVAAQPAAARPVATKAAAAKAAPPTVAAAKPAQPKRDKPPKPERAPRPAKSKRKAARWNPALPAPKAPRAEVLPTAEAERRFAAQVAPRPPEPPAPAPADVPAAAPAPERAAAPERARVERPRDDAPPRPTAEDRRREEDAWRAWSVAPKSEAAIAALAAAAADPSTTGPALSALRRDLVDALRLGPPEDVLARGRAALDAVAPRLAALAEHEAAAVGAAAASREQVVAAAEAAVELPDLKAASEAFKEAFAAWQQGPRLPREAAEPLFARLRAARERLDARWAAHKEEIGVERAERLGRLVRLAEQAERLATSRDPFAAAEQAKALQATWKTIRAGRGPEVDAAWERFRAACDVLFARRSEARAASDAANLAAREALIARGGALAEADDLADPDAAVQGLMKEWKRIGPVPRERADALWAEFRAVCDRIRAPRHVEGTSPADAPALSFSPFAGLAAAAEPAQED